MVVVVHHGGQSQLPEVVLTFGRLPFVPGSGQRGKEYGCEDRDDGDHHEELDQGEGDQGAPGCLSRETGIRVGKLTKTESVGGHVGFLPGVNVGVRGSLAQGSHDTRSDS